MAATASGPRPPTSVAKERKIEESFAEGDVPQLAYYTNPSAIKAHVRLFAPPDQALIKYAEKLKDTQTKEAMQAAKTGTK